MMPPTMNLSPQPHPRQPPSPNYQPYPLAGLWQHPGTHCFGYWLGTGVGTGAPRRVHAGAQGAAAVFYAGWTLDESHVHLPLAQPAGVAVLYRGRGACLQRQSARQLSGDGRSGCFAACCLWPASCMCACASATPKPPALTETTTEVTA